MRPVDNSAETSGKARYETPEIIELGTVDEVTKGGASNAADVGASSAP